MVPTCGGSRLLRSLAICVAWGISSGPPALWTQEPASARHIDSAATDTASVHVIDLSRKFLTFYDSAIAMKLGPDARWRLWKSTYGFAAVPPTPFGDTLARRLLDSAWARYPAAIPRIRQGASALGLSPDAELRRVVTALGCGDKTRVDLIIFVGGFEHNAFAFTNANGIPTVAIPLETGDALGSIVHEFTHAVHRSAGCADIKSGYGQSLAELVVSEGVAMRTTARLLRGSPPIRYIGGTQSWLDSAQARKADILRGIRDHLTESGAAVAQRFTFGDGTTGLHREAYYAGWEIIGALLDSGMSLHDIATTPQTQLPALAIRGIDAAQATSK
jgi:hypothetical protein